MTNMYTKQDDKLVQVIPQPDLVIETTLEELKRGLEASKARRDIRVMELAGAEQEVAGLEAKIAKCAELGIKEAVADVIQEPVTLDEGKV